MRQLAAEIRQHAGIIDGPQLVQQRVAGADALHRRRVEERKLFDVAEPEGLHAQDDVREVAALDLGLREARPVVEILKVMSGDNA
jgi:hypothetical protein